MVITVKTSVLLSKQKIISLGKQLKRVWTKYLKIERSVERVVSGYLEMTKMGWLPKYIQWQKYTLVLWSSKDMSAYGTRKWWVSKHYFDETQLVGDCSVDSIRVFLCVCVWACAEALGAECNHLLGLGEFSSEIQLWPLEPLGVVKSYSLHWKRLLNFSSEVFPDLFWETGLLSTL